MVLVTLATCNLDQWSLDFVGNTQRIIESIRAAKAAGARYRVGPELEVTGYGCEDHFLEMDMYTHVHDALRQILESDATHGILCDIGMPLMHRGVRYNCRVFCLDGKILLIRPKLYLADDGNYRESRWFTPWSDLPEHVTRLDAWPVPECLVRVCDCTSVPFGIGVLQCDDATLAAETCEELFTPASPHISLSLDGVDIISNGSGSHTQLRKLHTRIDLMRGASGKGGGVYMYANQQGCDGGRLYYDGCALILLNGSVVAQGSQFSVCECETLTATVELDDVRSFRGAFASRGQQAAKAPTFPRVRVPFKLGAADQLRAKPSPARPVKYHTPEEEIALGPACWMWDFLRRSGAAGFFLPLSGGADSAATCSMVGIMCHLVVDAVRSGDAKVIADVRRITSAGDDYIPASAAELANRIMHSCYMGTVNSSVATRSRAARLAAEVGAYHVNADIDAMVNAVLAVFTAIFGPSQPMPRFASRGGTRAEDLALQNVQARLRMVLAYFLAQLLPWTRGRRGFLLVLGSANVDEALRGYMTKYDCSSADINPIGAIAKLDLKRFLLHAAATYGYSTLVEIVGAPPTAELQPAMLDASGREVFQEDEVDMGMTYAELGAFGRLRKNERCGPLGMYTKLLFEWTHLTPREVADKVKRFFVFYSVNRHKLTTLTPSYHAEAYSPDDNRYDLRPFLYRTTWDAQFKAIDDDVAARGALADVDALKK